jgi:hypothetical protein
MAIRIVFRAAVLFLLVSLGILFVAAAKTFNAVDGSTGDDDTASIPTVSLSLAG